MDAPKKWRFRFGLRTLLTAIVACALLFAWVAYSLRWIEQRGEFRATHDDARVRGISNHGTSAPRFLWLFGERPVLAWLASEMSEADLAEAQRLFPEAEIIRQQEPR